MRKKTKQKLQALEREANQSSTPIQRQMARSVIQQIIETERRHSFKVAQAAAFFITLASAVVTFAEILTSAAPANSSIAYLGNSILDLIPSLTEVIDWVGRQSAFLVVAAGALLALFLFFMRGYFPKLYGILEICVGLLTIDQAAPSVTLNSIPSIIPFLAGIYVVIRGLDNVAKGLKPTSSLGRLFTVFFNTPSKKKDDEVLSEPPKTEPKSGFRTGIS